MNEPTKSEVDFACFKTQISTILDPRGMEEIAKRCALELRDDVLKNPAKYPRLYHATYPTLWVCLRMWWISFIRRLTRNSEWGRKDVSRKVQTK
jgi:hypothetical protein